MQVLLGVVVPAVHCLMGGKVTLITHSETIDEGAAPTGLHFHVRRARDMSAPTALEPRLRVGSRGVAPLALCQ